MEKLVEKLEDKIREIQESKTETEELGVSEDTINGYIKGIKHAISVVEDFKAENIKYLLTDSEEIKTELEIRAMFFREEVCDLLNNCEDYLNDGLELEHQLECIKLAKNGNMQEIMDRLNSCWNIPVVEIKY